MKGSRLISLVAIIATAMLLLPAILRAQQAGASIAVGISGTATVKAIDPAARTVTLETTDGYSRVIRCGPEVRNFDQIKVGDQVRAVAIEKMVLAVAKGSSPAADEAAVIARTPVGSKPGIIIGSTEQITAKVDAVDATTRTVTFIGADGQARPVKVSADVDLAGVAKGDEVTLRLSKGVMLWVQSPQDVSARLAGGAMTPQGALAAELAGLDIESITATSTVEAIDAEKRIVTLKNPAGQTRQIQLGRGAVNFDQIKVGDKVRATMVEEVAMAVSKGLAPSVPDSAVVVRAPQGAKPSILITDSTQVMGKIQSIDATRRSITVIESGGQPRSINVAPRVNLADFKAGDDINARVTQALAIVVEKP